MCLPEAEAMIQQAEDVREAVFKMAGIPETQGGWGRKTALLGPSLCDLRHKKMIIRGDLKQKNKTTKHI